MGAKAHLNKNGTYDVEVTCDTCKGSIVYTDKYGMFCEKKCGYEEAKTIDDAMEDLFTEVGNESPDKQEEKLMKGMFDMWKKFGNDK